MLKLGLASLNEFKIISLNVKILIMTDDFITDEMMQKGHRFCEDSDYEWLVRLLQSEPSTANIPLIQEAKDDFSNIQKDLHGSEKKRYKRQRRKRLNKIRDLWLNMLCHKRAKRIAELKAERHGRVFVIQWIKFIVLAVLNAIVLGVVLNKCIALTNINTSTVVVVMPWLMWFVCSVSIGYMIWVGLFAKLYIRTSPYNVIYRGDFDIKGLKRRYVTLFVAAIIVVIQAIGWIIAILCSGEDSAMFIILLITSLFPTGFAFVETIPGMQLNGYLWMHIAIGIFGGCVGFDGWIPACFIMIGADVLCFLIWSLDHKLKLKYDLYYAFE